MPDTSTSPISRPPGPRAWLRLRLSTLMLATLGVGILLALLMPRPTACNWPRAREAACTSNLKQIGIAIRAYRAAEGDDPPASSGDPPVSWRVLILKYDPDHAGVYKAYRLDQPWDGPDNRKLASLRPGFYACPNDNAADLASGRTRTGYLAAKGGDGRVAEVVELSGAGVHWMDPRDLDRDSLTLASPDPSGPAVLSLDGRVARTSRPRTPDEWRAYLDRPPE